jgi:hypothetical protein
VVDGAGSERWERGWKVEGLQCRRDGERERQNEIVTREARGREETRRRRDEKETRKPSTGNARKGDGQHLDFSFGQSFVFPRSGFRVCYHS